MHIVHDPRHFDLATAKWLPISTNHSVGLQELFTHAHDLADVEVPSPPGGAGLWRVLTVIAARVSGLDEPAPFDTWTKRREDALAKGHFSARKVTAYFDRHRSRFSLLHPERPWLQDLRLATECKKTSGLNKLVLSWPAGNNQVWFDHHTDLDSRPIPPGEAVWYLLAQLYYGPSGRCTARTVNGRNEANSTAGPLRGTISFHPLGRTVFESLIVGIPYPGSHRLADDLAPWERDELPHPLGLPPAPSGIAGRLTGRFRHAVLLSHHDGMVNDAWITWAWRHPTPPAEDPFLIYQVNKTGDRYARGAQSDRALWRDVDALLLERLGERDAQRPKVLGHASELPFDVLDHLRVRAFGFDQDGQTRDRQWFTATTPAVLSLLRDDQSASGLSRVRVAAEGVAVHLRSALRSVWVAINDPSNGQGPPARKDVSPGPLRDQGEAWYWPEAERIFWRKVWAREFDDPTLDFIKLALHIYDKVCDRAGNTPRVRRAVERNRGHIFAARNRPKAA
ncbi:type I-E CRISPR-associated protein Cse1/CasA [Spongiactinospora sp. 9N601]|uniref:type I-E CRISPR-associated protein Cse1/CasA n=1 Tax=Spongiactinospora sp. 9N601 TaxID=3375149 RepID=UPI003791856D